MMYDAKIDCWIAVVEWLPAHIRGMVTRNSDGSYMMFINARLSEKERRKVYRHERRHILRGDLYSDMPVRILEA